MHSSTGPSVAIELLEDGVVRFTNATCLDATLCNTCGIGGSSSTLADKVDALIAKVDALETQQTSMNSTMNARLSALETNAPEQAITSCLFKVPGTYEFAIGGTTFSGYCDGKGYLLVGKWGTAAGNYGAGPCAPAGGDDSQSPLDGTCSLADTALASGAKSCRLPDAVQNDEANFPWTKYKITASTSAGPDLARSIITPQHFEIKWCAHHSEVGSGVNGRKGDMWCYEDPPTHGDQCERLAGTNTIGVSPHESGHGGHWIHDMACTEHNCGFSCGFADAAESGCTIFEFEAQHWLFI
jgi:hypothetical protein